MHKVRYYLEVLYQMVSIYEENRCRRYIYITVGYNNDINISSNRYVINRRPKRIIGAAGISERKGQLALPLA